MSAAIARHGSAYGEAVCATWGMARSFYGPPSSTPSSRRQSSGTEAPPDQALLVAIADLEASPWEGEGYRKEGSARSVATSGLPASGCSA